MIARSLDIWTISRTNEYFEPSEPRSSAVGRDAAEGGEGRGDIRPLICCSPCRNLQLPGSLGMPFGMEVETFLRASFYHLIPLPFGRLLQFAYIYFLHFACFPLSCTSCQLSSTYFLDVYYFSKLLTHFLLFPNIKLLTF